MHDISSQSGLILGEKIHPCFDVLAHAGHQQLLHLAVHLKKNILGVKLIPLRSHLDLNLRFRLVETAKTFSDEITKINVGSTNAYYPYYMTKIRTNLITQGIQSYTWPAAIRGKLPKQVIIGFVDHSLSTVFSARASGIKERG